VITALFLLYSHLSLSAPEIQGLPKSEARLLESEARLKFLVLTLQNLRRLVSMLHSVKSGMLPTIAKQAAKQAAEQAEADVPLDGAVTKSEDCQRDICRNGLLQLQRTALELRTQSGLTRCTVTDSLSWRAVTF
jgi:hypothetical protein